MQSNKNENQPQTTGKKQIILMSDDGPVILIGGRLYIDYREYLELLNRKNETDRMYVSLLLEKIDRPKCKMYVLKTK
jgi:hypothetical protein